MCSGLEEDQERGEETEACKSCREAGEAAPFGGEEEESVQSQVRVQVRLTKGKKKRMDVVDGGGWGCLGKSAKNRIQVIPVKSQLSQRAVPNQSDLVWSNSKWATRKSRGQDEQMSLLGW